MAVDQKLQGTIFKYGPLQPHTAVVTGEFDRHVILVGGLGDGLLFSPYCAPLAAYLNENGWALVQPLLSSSYLSYGVGSLDKDADEIHLLATYLKDHFKSKGFVLMGHSTGCQDTVRYAKRHGGSKDAPTVLGYILQAPVSDREAQSGTSDSLIRERLDAAQLMETNGEAEEILFRDWEMRGAPISARRYLALVAVEGDDDLFSSDFSVEKLKEKLGHLEGVPTLLLMGGADECVPEATDKAALVERLAEAAGKTARGLVVPGGVHNLTGTEQELVQLVASFLSNI